MPKIKPEQTAVNVKISGNKDVVEKILRALHNISKSSRIGHSANFAIPVDGDGEDRVNVERLDGEPLPEFKRDSRYETHAEFSV